MGTIGGREKWLVRQTLEFGVGYDSGWQKSAQTNVPYADGTDHQFSSVRRGRALWKGVQCFSPRV